MSQGTPQTQTSTPPPSEATTATAAPTADQGPDHQELLVDHMVEMGFPRPQSRHALQLSDWRIDRALDFIQQQQHSGITDNTGNNTNDTHTARIPSSHAPVFHNPFADSSNRGDRITSGAVPQYHSWLSSRGLRGDTEEERQRFKEKQRALESERRRREKAESRRQLQLLRQQIKVEKRQKQRQLQQEQSSGSGSGRQGEGGSSAASTTTTTTSNTTATIGSSSSSSSSNSISSSSSVASIEVLVRLPDSSAMRLPDAAAAAAAAGNTATLQPHGPLSQIAHSIETHHRLDLPRGSYTLLVPFPRREFQPEQFDSVTLHEAGLVPRGSIVVQQISDKGRLQRGQAAHHGLHSNRGSRVRMRMSDEDDSDDEDDHGQSDDEDEDEDEEEESSPHSTTVSVGRVTSPAAAAAGGHPRRGSSNSSSSSIGGDSGDVLPLLCSCDMWYLSTEMTRRANRGQEGADHDQQQHEGRLGAVTLVLRPATDAEFRDMPAAAMHRRDAFKFLRSGVMSHTGLQGGVRTTRTMNFEVRHGAASGRSLTIVDDRGSRHAVEVLVLTTNSLILKVPRMLVPDIADTII